MPTEENRSNILLRVFAGYQFISDYYDRAELDAAINWSCETAEKDLSKILPAIKIEYYPVDIESGSILLRELYDQIKQAHFCILEISNPNNNVFFELGTALAVNKPTILIRASGGRQIPSLPSDLHGVTYLRYRSMGQLRAKLSKEILHKAKQILSSEQTIMEFLDHIWMRTSLQETVIIGEDIVTIKKGAGEKDVYYVHSGDALAIIEARMNYVYVNKEMKILTMSSNDVKGTDLNRNLILIGGPRSNKVTRRLLHELNLPWQFELGGELSSDWKRIVHCDRKEPYAALANDEVMLDYCMVLYGPNPFYSSANAILFAGLYTFGVLGGIRSLSATRTFSQVADNVRTILSKGWQPGKYFQVVTPVKVHNLDPVSPLFNIEDVEVM